MTEPQTRVFHLKALFNRLWWFIGSGSVVFSLGAAAIWMVEKIEFTPNIQKLAVITPPTPIIKTVQVSNTTALDALYVAPGDWVQPGDPLYTYDNEKILGLIAEKKHQLFFEKTEYLCQRDAFDGINPLKSFETRATEFGEHFPNAVVAARAICHAIAVKHFDPDYMTNRSKLQMAQQIVDQKIAEWEDEIQTVIEPRVKQKLAILHQMRQNLDQKLGNLSEIIPGDVLETELSFDGFSENTARLEHEIDMLLDLRENLSAYAEGFGRVLEINTSPEEGISTLKISEITPREVKVGLQASKQELSKLPSQGVISFRKNGEQQLRAHQITDMNYYEISSAPEAVQVYLSLTELNENNILLSEPVPYAQAIEMVWLGESRKLGDYIRSEIDALAGLVRTF